jgi:hypothetical protein
MSVQSQKIECYDYVMIYIIITTSINNKHGIVDYERRRHRYIDSITESIRLIPNVNDFKPIIVENNGNSNTYLNNIGCDVLYTDSNKMNFKHKGVNELIDIKSVIQHYNINDDDIIIKLTGRYKLLDSSFLQYVKDNSNNYDAFVKFFNVCTLEYMHDDCVLGLFAIRCKYLKDFNYDCLASPECEFAKYIRRNINRTHEIQRLGIEC